MITAMQMRGFSQRTPACYPDAVRNLSKYIVVQPRVITYRDGVTRYS